jgi:hypothetical protein
MKNPAMSISDDKHDFLKDMFRDSMMKSMIEDLIKSENSFVLNKDKSITITYELDNSEIEILELKLKDGEITIEFKERFDYSSKIRKNITSIILFNTDIDIKKYSIIIKYKNEEDKIKANDIKKYFMEYKLKKKDD